jgi:hypothetical protein
LRTATIFNLKNFLQLKSTSARLIVATVLFFTVGAMAETTNGLSDAEIQGRNLAQQLLEQRPATNFIQTGVLKIRDAKGISTNLFLRCRIIADSTNWFSDYVVSPTSSLSTFLSLKIFHKNNSTNSYVLYKCDDGTPDESCYAAGADLLIDVNTPFANSDFWAGDLGLEFFHWPEQRVLKKELKRSRGCEVLESTNPNPSTNGYSRVVSWIDEESGGIVHAEAYDAAGKLLKVFDPKSFKKVNGQWELQEMEIRNVQTGSRSRIEFDLNKQ